MVRQIQPGSHTPKEVSLLRQQRTSHSSKNRHHSVPAAKWCHRRRFNRILHVAGALKGRAGGGQDARGPGVGLGAMPVAEGWGAPQEYQGPRVRRFLAAQQLTPLQSWAGPGP